MVKDSLLTIILCLWLLPITAEGAELVTVSVSQDETWYVDVNSIKQVTFTEYMAWIKVEALEFYLGIIKEAEGDHIFDCAEGKSKHHQETLFYINNHASTYKAEEWEYATPESNYENVLNFVCDYAKGVIKRPKKENE